MTISGGDVPLEARPRCRDGCSLWLQTIALKKNGTFLPFMVMTEDKLLYLWEI